jgi:ABC-type uncharacterized transport system fused permease/ATPase subunit
MKKQQFKLNMDHTLTTDFEKRIVDVRSRRYLLLKNGNHIRIQRIYRDLIDFAGNERTKLYGQGKGIIGKGDQCNLIELEFGMNNYSKYWSKIIFFGATLITLGATLLIERSFLFIIPTYCLMFLIWYLYFRLILPFFIEELIHDFKLIN